MKMVRSLLLGSAAGIVGVAGASAADLPLKARPAEYVKVCSIYGAGFFYIPGTDTCIKIGGYVRAEWGANASAGSLGPYINGANGADTRMSQGYSTRTRSVLSFDTRTQTEYGTLRSYIRGGWEINSGDANYRGITYFDRAFVQFAGFTAGKTQSFFAFYANAVNYTTEVGGGQFDVGLNLLAYTAQFAGGFSATISLEDNNHERGGIYDATAGGLVIGAIPGGAAPVYGDYGGSQYPDIVGNLRVDQPWGSAQISAAIHDVYAAYQGANVNTNPSGGDATGFAVQGGVMFNLPWAQGDTFWAQATWARGGASYLGLSPFIHVGGQIAMYSGSPNLATCTTGGAAAANTGCGNVALGYTLDAVSNGTIAGLGTPQLTEGWAINLAAEHYWTPAFRTSVYGQYTELNFPGNSGFVNGAAVAGTASGAKGAFCNGGGYAGGGALPGTTGVAGTVCDPSYSVFQVGVRNIWSPVRNLDIGVEVLYTRMDSKMLGNYILPAFNGRVQGTYAAADQDTWGGILRVQRNFWP